MANLIKQIIYYTTWVIGGVLVLNWMINSSLEHQEKQKQQRLEAMNYCVDHGGGVEINSNGSWSCILDNKTLTRSK